YRRADAAPVMLLVAALRECRLDVCIDRTAIDEFGPITDGIRKGLAESKALLAWYSEDYPRSRPCEMELTAAFIAAQREGDPRRRGLVVNPAASPAHIEPIELRGALYAAAPARAPGDLRVAGGGAAHGAPPPRPLGGILPLVPPDQYGLKLTGANRFVGRHSDLWRIHSALQGSDSAIISGSSAAGLAQVTGLGGIGKSLIAEEYALSFGAACPG